MAMDRPANMADVALPASDGSVPSFGELLERVRKGDGEAATLIARLYERDLQIVARVQLGPALRPYLDSIDLVQSVHRSLLLGLRQKNFDISTPENLIGLAMTMLRRKIARHWRQLKRQQRLSMGRSNSSTVPGVLAELTSPGSDPTQSATLRDAVQRLWKELDATERLLIELRIEGYSTAEVARDTNLDADVLRVRLSRLRQRLQAKGILTEWL